MKSGRFGGCGLERRRWYRLQLSFGLGQLAHSASILCSPMLWGTWASNFVEYVRMLLLLGKLLFSWSCGDTKPCA